MAPKKPVVIITLQGKKPELQSLLLTSHMDVVPVYPVSAYTKNNNLRGRHTHLTCYLRLTHVLHIIKFLFTSFNSVLVVLILE